MVHEMDTEELAERMKREHAELLDRLGRTVIDDMLRSARREAPLITAGLKALAEARALVGAGQEEEDDPEKEYPGMGLEAEEE